MVSLVASEELIKNVAVGYNNIWPISRAHKNEGYMMALAVMIKSSA